jgi:hypothetical protein
MIRAQFNTRMTQSVVEFGAQDQSGLGGIPREDVRTESTRFSPSAGFGNLYYSAYCVTRSRVTLKSADFQLAGSPAFDNARSKGIEKNNRPLIGATKIIDNRWFVFQQE